MHDTVCDADAIYIYMLKMFATNHLSPQKLCILLLIKSSSFEGIIGEMAHDSDTTTLDGIIRSV